MDYLTSIREASAADFDGRMSLYRQPQTGYVARTSTAGAESAQWKPILHTERQQHE